MKTRASGVTPADARTPDLDDDAEHAALVLANDASTGLQQALAGQFMTDEDLDEALGDGPHLSA